MANEFAITSIEITHLYYGIVFRVITDVPCTLTMFATTKRPKAQAVTRERRGIAEPNGKRYCFTEYEDLPEEDPSDTTLHRFGWRYWMAGQTRYCSFRATIGGVQSPSSGPMWAHYHPGQDVFKNPYFYEWTDPSPIPLFWQAHTTGTGWSRWEKYLDPTFENRYLPRMEAGGYVRMTLLRQYVSPRALRGWPLYIRVVCNGYRYSNNGIVLATSGPGSNSQISDHLKNHEWEHLRARVFVNELTEEIIIACRVYSPQYGPIFGRFAEIYTSFFLEA